MVARSCSHIRAIITILLGVSSIGTVSVTQPLTPGAAAGSSLDCSPAPNTEVKTCPGHPDCLIEGRHARFSVSQHHVEGGIAWRWDPIPGLKEPQDRALQSGGGAAAELKGLSCYTPGLIRHGLGIIFLGLIKVVYALRVQFGRLLVYSA